MMIILKKSMLFNYKQLNDFTCVDNLNILKHNFNFMKHRFTLIYIISALKYNSKLILKVSINETEQIPSLENIYICINWLEREVYDMFGIIFQNHSDLRRILTDYGFLNNPLLKNFPLTGFLEVKYLETIDRVAYEPVKLIQEYRFFNFESPWNQYVNKLSYTTKVL